MAMTTTEQACIVQRSQARADFGCVNCGKTVGTPHKIMCYEGTKALRHVERHTVENPNCDYCTGRM